ncbi:MAG TPA: zf-HC2 domain-containing protein, partial [Pirellulales bacterium]
MNHPADDELLSAYLDGELAEDERARVERLLAEQAESRQLLDELRSVKQRLESMPAARLGDDFADRVLRQAEREMLTEGFRVQGSEFSQPATKQGVRCAPQSKIENLKSKIGRHRRSVVWASLAVAAGLLLMFFDRDRQHRPAEKQVAMAPQVAEQRRGGALPRDAEIGAAPGGPAAEKSNRELRDLSELSVGLGESTVREHQRGSAPMSDRLELGVDASGEAPLVDDQTLVVWCELSPDAPSQESFSQLLAQQNIAWQPPGEAGQGSQPSDPPGRSKDSRDFFYQSQTGKNVSIDAAKLTDTLKRR